MTQADAAQALGIDPSWLSQVECGRKRPSIRLLQRMAELYRVKPSKLVELRRGYDKAAS
jgi:transcriptional regulator with XRE-family HTH domain